jgi:uncharacterized protein DUF6545
MIIQVVLLLCLVLAAVTRICTAVVALRHRGARLVLGGGLALLAAGQLLSLPALTDYTDTATVAGAGKVSYNVATMSGLFVLIVFFIRATRPRPDLPRLSTGHTAVFITVTAMMIGLMVATPAGMRHHSLQSPFITAAPVASFYILGNLYFAYAYLSCGRYVLRYIAQRPSHTSPLMRLSLRLIIAAAVGLFVTSLGRGGWVLAKVCGIQASETFDQLNWQTSNISFLVLAAGLSLQVAADIATTIRLLRVRIRQYHDMTPLWAGLKQAYPEIVVRWWWPAGRYYRRVTECLDGLARLRPHLAAAANGTDLSNCDPPELARHVGAALRTKPPLDTSTTAVIPVQLPIPSDHDQSVAWLVGLAKAFREYQAERLPA